MGCLCGLTPYYCRAAAGGFKLSGVEGIYDRHTYFDERKEALEKWARFLAACEAG